MIKKKITTPSIKIVKKKITTPSIKIESSHPLWKRIWVLIKNPFTYIFCGYVEY